MAVVLISTAVVFSVLRAVLPHATGYKNEIQQEISRQIGLPVEIESIDAAIHWFSPRLKLIRVSIFDKKNTVPLFDFREAFVELDVVASILRQEFIIADVGLIGTDISIEKFSEKEWSVQGVRFTSGSSGGSGELPKEFLYMLENSDYLLHDSNIYYQDHTGDKLSVSLLNVNIDVENNFNQHDLRFSMLLPEAFGGQLSLVASLSGDLDALDGDIFLEAEQLKIRQWNKKFKFLKKYQLEAQADIKLWVTIEKNNLQSSMLSLSSSDVLIKNNKTKKTWKTDYLSGDLRYVKDKEHWNITLSDFYFGKESSPVWGRPVTVLASDDADNIYLSADFLRLSDLQNITDAVITDEYRADFKKLKAYRVSADIYNLDLQLPKKLLSETPADEEAQSPVKIEVAVSEAGSKLSARNRPEGLRGKVKHGVILTPKVAADTEGESKAEEPLASQHIDGHIHDEVSSPPDDAGAIDSSATVDTAGVTANKTLNPLDGLSLQATVVDFSVHDAGSGLTLVGFDAALTFTDNRITVDVATKNAGMQMPEMLREPVSIDTIHGQLKMDYDGEAFHLVADDLHIKNKHIDIFSRLDIYLSSMDDIFVDVQADFYDAYGKYVHHYLPVGIMDPALVEWLDMAVVDGYIPEGSVILQGKLADFPFPNKAGIFQAMFSPQNVSMTFLEDWPPLTNASASIKFNNLSLYVHDAKGKMQSAELYGGYAEILKLPDPHLTVRTKARSRNKELQTFVWNSPLDEILGDTLRLFSFDGNNELDLTLQVPLNEEQVDVAIDGHLNFIDSTMTYTDLGYELSALNGTVDFTNDSIFADLVKAEMQGRPVQINAFTENDKEAGRQVVFHVDGVMEADYLLQHYDWIPQHWVSGASKWSVDVEVPYEPKSYLVRVEANSHLEGVVLQMSDKVSKTPEEKLNFSTDINILSDDRLYVQAVVQDSDQKNLLEMHADRSGKRVWSFDVQSAYMTGAGAFDESLSNDTEISLDLENIDLYAMFVSSDKEGSQPLRPDDFPALSWHADNVLWDDWHFTDVQLQTRWQEHGMTIKKLVLKGPAMSFDAKGSWLNTWSGSQETMLEGSIESTNLGDTLTGLGFERSLDRCSYNAVFNSKWPAEPYALSWANMKGKTSFEMKDGEILEVDPGAGGRILGLLNIFKLANRLALDFDDVTRKGFSFDNIKGDFEFVNGDGSLKNFDVSAAAADINMFGSIGMVKHDYGLLMRVKPHTDTLTFAGGVLLGGVAVGAGLALIQKVFDISIIGHNVYSITGTWDEPKIEKIVETTPEHDEYDF